MRPQTVLISALVLAVGASLMVRPLSALPPVDIQGEVRIQRQPDDDLLSAGHAEAIDAFGRITMTALLIADHRFLDAQTGETVFRKENILGVGAVDSSFRVPRPPVLCVRARFTARADLTDLVRHWGSPQVCIETDVPDPPEPPPENCPVLLDLAQDGFHLSGPESPVSFDIDADGEREAIAWTQAGSDDAFLCRDLDGNGRIDDGRELFGWATLLAGGAHAVVGFRALTELDWVENGGNEDGWVDARDAAFSSLCTWTDRNRNGATDPGELAKLSASRVVGLRFDYRQTGLVDRHGNAFRYVASSRTLAADGRVRAWPVFDVVFAAERRAVAVPGLP
jgi:hypothetical protein